MSNQTYDELVDVQILECMNLDSLKSFNFLAGAGAGKTRTLVRALERFRELNGDRLRRYGQKIAVITYTNAACDEIKRRLNYDPTFTVSTIHSFAWELIKHHSSDIRDFIRNKLTNDILELEKEQSKGRSNTSSALDRDIRIKRNQKRLESLNGIPRFTYSPDGQKIGKSSLSHREILDIASYFLLNKKAMQSILIKNFPIVFIDECQDTQKDLMESFEKLAEIYSGSICVGRFGDSMQRIYSEGKQTLENGSEIWKTFQKKTNYRCPVRIVNLVNKIRFDEDKIKQEPKFNSDQGFVRLFLIDVNNPLSDRLDIENKIKNEMACITGDAQWISDNSGNKTLILEHKMAAVRGNFYNFFNPLYDNENTKDDALRRAGKEISFFADQVLPLVKAFKNKNNFSIIRILSQFSPLLHKDNLHNNNQDNNEIHKTKVALNNLMSLWDNNQDPTLISILLKLRDTRLLSIPEYLFGITEILITLSKQNEIEKGESERSESIIEPEPKFAAWINALKCQFSQFENYYLYISGDLGYDTHQGVKGLEFPRVMVINDDSEAKGFLFSFEKLFGARTLSDRDQNNINKGNDNSLSRTRRLFYVTCSRAEKSLAVVNYTSNPQAVKDNAIKNGWFESNEILLVSNSDGNISIDSFGL